METGRKGRTARLAAELRENLARRKTQARARRGGGSDARSDGLAAAGQRVGGAEGLHEQDRASPEEPGDRG